MDVVRQVVRTEGGVIGLYRGLVPTLLREVPGCSAMFAAYEAIKLGAAKQQVACWMPIITKCVSWSPANAQHHSTTVLC